MVFRSLGGSLGGSFAGLRQCTQARSGAGAISGASTGTSPFKCSATRTRSTTACARRHSACAAGCLYSHHAAGLPAVRR